MRSRLVLVALFTLCVAGGCTRHAEAANDHAAHDAMASGSGSPDAARDAARQARAEAQQKQMQMQQAEQAAKTAKDAMPALAKASEMAQNGGMAPSGGGMSPNVAPLQLPQLGPLPSPA